MSRFSADYDYDYEWANAGELWWANVERALSGKRGQEALRDLETALLALPKPRLIRGAIAAKDEVCAVGALALHRRLTAGEKRDAILADLEGRTPPECECGHLLRDHNEDGSCGHPGYGDPPSGCWAGCTKFVLDEEGQGNYDGADETAQAGVQVGLTYVLAWQLAYLNDETFGDATPEERYDKVLGWVREAQLPAAVSSGGGDK